MYEKIQVLHTLALIIYLFISSNLRIKIFSPFQMYSQEALKSADEIGQSHDYRDKNADKRHITA